MLTKECAFRLLEKAVSTGGDFAEIYAERKFTSSYECLNGKLEKANSGETVGVGIRIYQGLKSVYSYSNELDEESLMKMVENLSKSVHGEERIEVKELREVKIESAHPILKPLAQVPANEKIELLKRADRTMRAYDECIKTAQNRYSDEVQDVTIYNTEGKMVHDHRERTRIYLMAVAQEGSLRQDAGRNPGAHQGFEFYDKMDIEGLAKETCASAITMLHAQDCPSGEMTVVIDNGFGGVIFHEACGHSLEATSVAKGNSVFCGKLGQKIASECVTAVDDGTIVNGWGSGNIDDEGNPCQCNVLIENGILKSYMVDRLNARRMKCEVTGSARRESYKYEPTSRMTNTFLVNGQHTFDEIIQATKKGLYAKQLGGGSVNPSTGEFNFSCREAYLIEDGKITKPVKGATLIGNGADTLLKIDMVADNLLRAQGMCGSSSGSIPADVGQPTIRVSSMTVGGKGGKFE